MIIGELTKYNLLNNPKTNYAPFVYQFLPSYHITADYWKYNFGAADESVDNITIYISIVARGSTILYIVIYLELDCIAQEQSFYWDNTNQKLYIHFEHDQQTFTDIFEYGIQRGFTKERVIYIDNVLYQPLILSIPNIAQQQDIINYNKLSGINGNIELNNTQGILDDLITEKVFGNNFQLYYLEYNGTENYSRSELIPLNNFFVDDYEIGMKIVSLYIEDRRFIQNIKIPIETFTEDEYPNINEKYLGDIIPLAYGSIRSSEAIPVDGDLLAGETTFRQAQILTTLGTVQVLIDDLWTTKIPTSTDLPVGTFTLAQADSRQANGVPYKCRVLNSIGIVNTYSSDIIINLNNRYLNIEYLASNYDTTEWEAEQTQLETIGILFNKQIELFEAIRQIQNGSNVGFRYEINATGKRTIRIDDWDREPIKNVTKQDIKNIQEIKPKSNKDLVAAIIKCNYAYDYELKKYLYINDESEADYVLSNYRIQKLVELDTCLTTIDHAEQRATDYAERYKDVPIIIPLQLHGPEWYTLRIYDILEDVEISPGMVDSALAKIIGREYYGIWKVQVLEINPDFNNIVNNIKVLLLEKREPVTIIRITTAGRIRLGSDYIKRMVTL